MTQKLSYRDIEMDVMERLYYERKAARQRAYTIKRKKVNIKKQISHKNPNKTKFSYL